MHLGYLATAVLLAVFAATAFGVAGWVGEIAWLEALTQPRVWRIIRFTLFQAALSTAISLALAVPLALALVRRQHFFGRSVLVHLASVSLVIPAMVAVIGIAMIHGRAGWVNDLLVWFGWERQHYLYGLSGILIAHVFFNWPLSTRVLMQSLSAMPPESWRVARQLGLTPWQAFCLLEWPLLKSALPSIAGVVFLLCFTSFAIVLTLGGGPKSSTLEVAIYQALRFDFDLGRAVVLSVIQIVCCGAILWGFRLIATPFSFQHTDHFGDRHAVDRYGLDSWYTKVIDCVIITCACLFLLSPLVAVGLHALDPVAFKVLSSRAFLQALVYSLVIALFAGVLSLLLAVPMALLVKDLNARSRGMSAGMIDAVGVLLLFIPPFTFGTGLFLFLRQWFDVFSMGTYLVVLINALVAIPFVLRIMLPPIHAWSHQVDRLNQSLGITGWNAWWIIYCPALRQPLAFAFAVATALSLGDMGVIALFGTQDLTTLPLLIYRLMGAYRMDEAAVVSLVLCLLCFGLFFGAHYLMKNKETQHAGS